MPPAVELQHRPTGWGVIRSRTAGTKQAGVPEVVVVHGLAVADYLDPTVPDTAPGPARIWSSCPVV